MLLSSPVFFACFVSSDINSIHSAVLFSDISRPAAAMGIEHMGDLFLQIIRHPLQSLFSSVRFLLSS